MNPCLCVVCSFRRHRLPSSPFSPSVEAWGSPLSSFSLSLSPLLLISGDGGDHGDEDDDAVDCRAGMPCSSCSAMMFVLVPSILDKCNP